MCILAKIRISNLFNIKISYYLLRIYESMKKEGGVNYNHQSLIFSLNSIRDLMLNAKSVFQKRYKTLYLNLFQGFFYLNITILHMKII